MKQLTLAIPTYNRFVELARLINAIARERAVVEFFDELCEVLVLDNSSDWYRETSAWQRPDWNFVKFVSHSDNIGADANVRACYKSATSRYVWIMGDDDLPKFGLLSFLLQILKEQSPSLVYIKSTWQSAHLIEAEYGRTNHESLCACRVTASELALRAGTALTFISSIVVSKTELAELCIDPDAYANTQVPQLSWILPSLERERKLLFMSGAAVIATSCNSGGYSVLNVFAKIYPSTVSHALNKEAPQLVKILHTELVLNYLPDLLNHLRTDQLGEFNTAESFPSDVSISSMLFFRTLKWACRSLGMHGFLAYVIICKCIYRIYRYFELISIGVKKRCSSLSTT